MIEHLTTLIIQFITSHSYAAVLLFMTLESALIPIPSEITLPFAGFLAHNGSVNFLIILSIAILGDLTGTLILYALGYFLEETVILSLIDKYGKFILLSRHEYDKVMHWFAKRGAIIITIAKLLPGFRSIIGLPAGLSETPLHRVIIYTLIGSVIWCTGFTYAGFVMGKNWETLHPIFQKFEFLIIGLLVIAVLWYLNHKLKILDFKK